MDAPVLLQDFRERFPKAPAPRVCRAPGRINLVGEHTDYNGLPVLPMTIREDIRIAFAPREDGIVRMQNSDRSYPNMQFTNGPSIPPSATGSWDNYCKAAVQALNARFHLNGNTGMDLLVHGAIPIAAGLSSSSALVVASALAYLSVCGKRLGPDISRLELAAPLAEAEPYVGTQGGGMDQAIILMGGAGVACKIDFFPLRIERVPVPGDHIFVTCDSGVKARKTGNALHRYNAGPRSCRLIRALVEKQAQEEFGDEIQLERVGDLWLGHLCLTNGEAEGLLERALPRERTTLEEAARALGSSAAEIRERWLDDLPEPEGGFRLRARARHLRTEYRRVEAARDALLGSDADEFGRLMNESHRSCAVDYEISGPELDKLVEIAREAGAVGARLTGAGFGGCTVNLVPEDELDDFRRQVFEDYYEDYAADRELSLTDAPFLAGVASAGADYLDK